MALGTLAALHGLAGAAADTLAGLGPVRTVELSDFVGADSASVPYIYRMVKSTSLAASPLPNMSWPGSLLVLALALGSALTPSSAEARRMAIPISLEREIPRAALIVEAELERVERGRAHFRVVAVWKGETVVETLTLPTIAARRRYPWGSRSQVGETFLLLLRKARSGRLFAAPFGPSRVMTPNTAAFLRGAGLERSIPEF